MALKLICDICKPFLSTQRRCIAGLASQNDNKEDSNTQAEKQAHQFFLSGVRFLKDDLTQLSTNLTNRGVTLDVNKMV